MRGSITLFATLVLMLIGQFLFTLVEAGRFVELDKVALMDSEANTETIFAQYCKPLWDEYNLLLYDGGKGSKLDIKGIENYLEQQVTGNFAINTDGKSNNTSTLRLGVDSVDIPQYTLMTDQQGEVFMQSVSSYMKENFAYEAAKKMYSNYQSIKSIMDNGNNYYSSGGHRINFIENDMKSGFMTCTVSDKSGDCSGNSSDDSYMDFTGDVDVGGSVVQNPLVSVKEAQAGGVLKLVMSEDKISGNQIDLSNSVSERTLNTGVNPEVSNNGWYDSILVQQYLMSYMSCYSNPIDNHAMKYELEYLIGGDSSDKENLTAVVEKLLLIRGTVDFMYLCTDTGRQSQAMLLATGIAVAMLNPGLAEVIKWAILMGWAYCESVLDVRALLAGERIPLMKSNGTWTSGLFEIPVLLTNDTKAKGSKLGQNYKDYLGILLLANNNQTIAYRAMDMQEASVRMNSGYENFRMDNGICQLQADYNYEYHGLFTNFISLINIGSNEFHIKKTQKYSYYKQS